MCSCTEQVANSPTAQGAPAASGPVPPVVTPEVPLADRVTIDDGGASSGAGEAAGLLKPCRTVLRNGCYAMTFRPVGLKTFEGTLRVDRSGPDAGPDGIIVSGDLYRRPLLVPPPFPDVPGVSVAAGASSPDNEATLPPLIPRIPIFSRGRYHSYLKVTSVTSPAFVPVTRPCTVTLVVEQFDYTQPAAGTFQGSFPVAPSRTVTLALKQVAPSPFGGLRFEGSWSEGGVDKGVVTLTRVSSFFRRAILEIDTLVGSVPPQPVPDGVGGTEFFDTVYAKAGWDLRVVRDQLNIPVPAGVTPTDCWSSPDLHALMAAHRNASTDLDKEWRVHLMVVPANLTCSRGRMYDSIDVPREACASFSDDGYPTSHSANFGVAANEKQRDVPRAYLRSATHEVTHTFNQIHQEQETVADNSIMTTTPSVADVLGGPTTGAPGVFPDQIDLTINATVRNHLVHMPDPVIRPGGWPFASWFGSTVPQAGDRQRFERSELELSLTGPSSLVALGEPFEVTWTLTNRGDGALVVPNDVSLEGLFASMWITDPGRRQRPFRAYVIDCENVRLAVLNAGATVTATHRVFWSTDGFAFPRPGPYRVTVALSWSANGIPVGVEDDLEVFVDYPISSADNAGAGLVLSPEVGKWVALGGGAYHLTEATSRLSAMSSGQGADTADSSPRLMAGFDGLMPDPDRAADPGSAADAGERSTARSTRSRRKK